MKMFYIRFGLQGEMGDWHQVNTHDLEAAQFLACMHAEIAYDAVPGNGMAKLRQYRDEMGLDKASHKYRDERSAAIDFEAIKETPEEFIRYW